MRDSFPFIDVLTLPIDATTGTRIIIDGVQGRIEFYDAANNLVGLLRSNPTPLQFWGNASGARIQLEPGQLSVYDTSGLERIVVDSTGVYPDITYDGLSFPRGLVRQIADRTNDGPFSASSVSDMVISNVPVIAGRMYAVDLHCQVLMGSDGAGSGLWSVEFRVNGTSKERFAAIDEVGAIRKDIDAQIFWFPTVTAATDDVDVYLRELVDGATVTLEGSSGTPNVTRTLTITDLGK